MPSVQLNVRVDKALAERLRQEAKKRRQNPSALVSQALEKLLAPPSKPSVATPSNVLAALEATIEALKELTERVEALEQQRQPVIHQKDDLPSPPRATTPPAPKEPKPIAVVADGALTTAELASATNTNRSAWNNWANAPGRIGAVRNHPTAGAWRLLGKSSPPAGGPERWIWEQVSQ